MRGQAPKERVHLRFDPDLLARLDEFARIRGLTRTWCLEQSVRLLMELVEARAAGERIVRVTESDEVVELRGLYEVNF